MLKRVLFWNGIADLAAAVMLIGFPSIGWRIPGFGALGPDAAFAAGGWGVAALTLGIGRIWAAHVPACRRLMAVLGVIEGVVLTGYCLLRVAFSPTTIVQTLMPLAVGAVFAALYAIGLARRGPGSSADSADRGES